MNLPDQTRTTDPDEYVDAWRRLAEWCENRWPRLRGRRLGWDPDLAWDDGTRLPAWLVLDLMSKEDSYEALKAMLRDHHPESH